MTQKPVFVEGVFTLRSLRTMGAAAVVEILLALGVAAILIWQQVRPPVVSPPVRQPIVDFPQQPLPLPHNVPVPKQPEQTEPLHQVQAVPTDVPMPTTQPVQGPPPPLSPVRQSRPPADVMDDFTHRMVQAINAQKVYPKLQMLKGVTGETVVSFDYVDGVVSGIRVDKSSGTHELDEAAMQAVQRVVLPSKPAELAGLDHFVLTLEFNIDR